MNMTRSKRQVVADLQKKYTVQELRALAQRAGVTRKRGDSKKQTAWRIVQQAESAARNAA